MKNENRCSCKFCPQNKSCKSSFFLKIIVTRKKKYFHAGESISTLIVEEKGAGERDRGACFE